MSALSVTQIAPKRVALNAAVSARGASGTSRVIDLLLEALRSDPSLTTSRLDPPWSRGSNRVVNFVQAASWDLWTAPRLARSSEVFVAPANIGRSTGRARMLLVLHDTMVLDMPALFDRGYAWWARAAFGLSVRRAHTILCPSEYTARCIQQRWGAKRVVVVPHPNPYADGVSSRPRTAPGTPGQLLMVGATEPHKEHVAGIEAARILRSIGCAVELTVIGPAGRAEADVGSAIAAADPHHRWIHRAVDVSEDDLRAAYRRADVLLQPSRAEGFGLPVLEAASFGVPTVHSGLGSLSEIAPAGGVGGVDAVRFARRARALLEGHDYERESVDALGIAERYSPARFRSRVLDVVHGMIEGQP